MLGEIFDIKRFAIHDGPGIRCTAFLKGCPLNCVWCHNPEGKRPGMEIRFNERACIRCGKCVAVCSNKAIELREKAAHIDRYKCKRCGYCAVVCPSKAISIVGYQVDSEKLIRDMASESLFFRNDGGITLSGGEPLFQPEFAKDVLGMAKAADLHTVVETCLCASSEVINSLIPYVDLWIADLKIMDPYKHRWLTHVDNEPILRGYELLVEKGCDMLTRIPVIPGATDSPENLNAIGRYIASVNPKGEVELMFYNPLGESKCYAFGLDDAMKGKPYTSAQKKEFINIVAATGVNVINQEA